MKHLFRVCVPFVATATLLCVALTSRAAPLYDPGRGSFPSAQGWITTGQGGPYTESLGGGHYVFGTLAADVTRAGSARLNNASLDTLAGFNLDFNLRVVEESHGRVDRAGFSFIATGLDPAHSIEIAFWADHVWAYTDTFAHGVDAAFDTTAAHDYSLVVRNNAYVLKADGADLFSGALVDYAGQPYDNPGFLFFGDDTSSARSQVALGVITLAPVPEPATTALFAAGLLGLALWRQHGRQRARVAKAGAAIQP